MKEGKVVFVVIKRKCKRPILQQLAQVSQEKRWYSQNTGGSYV
jgi:hypothetical protein